MNSDIASEDHCAVQWAIRYGHIKVVQYLASKGTYISQWAVREACLANHFDLVEYLILYCNISESITLDNYKKWVYIKNKSKHRACKKIYFWWIPICHNVLKISGQKIIMKNVSEFKRLCEQLN